MFASDNLRLKDLFNFRSLKLPDSQITQLPISLVRRRSRPRLWGRSFSHIIFVLITLSGAPPDPVPGVWALFRSLWKDRPPMGRVQGHPLNPCHAERVRGSSATKDESKHPDIASSAMPHQGVLSKPLARSSCALFFVFRPIVQR